MASQSSTSIDAASLFRVDGLVALITGGGSGIGYMFAKALAHNGAAKVYIAARRLEVLEKAAASIGPNVHPIVCDVTSKDSLSQAVKKVEEEVGYLNLLVCNSGIFGPSFHMNENTSLEEWADNNWGHSMEDYTQTFNVNVSSVWFSTVAFAKLLKKGNEKKNVDWTSSVVVISSIAAINKKPPGGWAYGQSKAAALHLMKHLSVALPQWDLRVNAICPGLFPSDMASPILQKLGDESGQNISKSKIPLGRAGDEKDMGGTMLYLASRAGAYLNGATVVIDGGRMIYLPSTY